VPNPAEVTDFLNAGSALHSAEGGAALYDYVADVRESLKKENVKGRALIVESGLFRQGGVTEALRTVAGLNKVVKVAVYGEDAKKLRILAGNSNIIIADTLDAVLAELKNNYGIEEKDAVLWNSTAAVVVSRIKQVVTPDEIPATLALAKALHELFSDTITRGAFETLLARMVDAEVIDSKTLNESREELLGMLQEGQTFAFKTELVTERMSKEVEIADAQKRIKKFMGKYI